MIYVCICTFMFLQAKAPTLNFVPLVSDSTTELSWGSDKTKISISEKDIGRGGRLHR